jgi:hypothetical protein
MPMTTKAVLILVYPLLLLAWLVNLVLRRDRLRLRDIANDESYWIERRAQPTTQSYFSEESCAEGGGETSAARAMTRFLRVLALLYAPRRQAGGGNYKASAERERGIPDEVYTLW